MVTLEQINKEIERLLLKRDDAEQMKWSLFNSNSLGSSMVSSQFGDLEKSIQRNIDMLNELKSLIEIYEKLEDLYSRRGFRTITTYFARKFIEYRIMIIERRVSLAKPHSKNLTQSNLGVS